jgi:hypothetical protein
MNSLKALILIAGTAIKSSTVFADAPLSNQEVSQCRHTASLIVQRADAYYKANGWEFSPVDVSTFQMKPVTMVVWQIPEVWIDHPGEPVAIEMERSSGGLGSFVNVLLEHKKKLLSDAPPSKQWTEGRVKDMARSFITAMLGSMPSKVSSEPSVRFSPGREGDQYYAGTWYVIFGRIDSKGHLFRRDSMGVSMRDGDGPSRLSVNFWSIYDDRSTESIPKEQALKAASEGAKKLLAWAPARDWFENSSLVVGPQAELQIVNPNYLWERSSVEDAGSTIDLNARLAWVVTYKRSENAAIPDGGKPAAGQLEIWVDAENGELLGGDFR